MFDKENIKEIKNRLNEENTFNKMQDDLKENSENDVDNLLWKLENWINLFLRFFFTPFTIYSSGLLNFLKYEICFLSLILIVFLGKFIFFELLLVASKTSIKSPDILLINPALHSWPLL